jgi:hypothetical protein
MTGSAARVSSVQQSSQVSLLCSEPRCPPARVSSQPVPRSRASVLLSPGLQYCTVQSVPSGTIGDQ